MSAYMLSNVNEWINEWIDKIITYQIHAMCQAWCLKGRELEVKEMVREIMGGKIY